MQRPYALYGRSADVGQGQKVIDESERGVLSVKQCNWLLAKQAGHSWVAGLDMIERTTL